MISLTELLEKKSKGEALTKEEEDYFAKYKEQRNVRHSTSFIYHSRKIPKEGDVKRAD